MISFKFKNSYLPGFLLSMAWLLIAVAPYGCSRSPFDGLQEGKVIYDVTVEDGNSNAMMAAMAPSEAITYFGDNKTCTVMKMAMNMMEMRLITDSKNYNHTVLFSGMGNKVALKLDKEQVDKNFADRVELQVRHTSETKEIAGVTCKQVIITDSTNHTYPVYYTDEISVNSPNWSSPFKEIDGLLMEFSVNIGGLVLNLKAKEIVNTKNEQAFFEIPEGYKIIKDPSELNFKL